MLQLADAKRFATVDNLSEAQICCQANQTCPFHQKPHILFGSSTNSCNGDRFNPSRSTSLVDSHGAYDSSRGMASCQVALVLPSPFLTQPKDLSPGFSQLRCLTPAFLGGTPLQISQSGVPAFFQPSVSHQAPRLSWMEAEAEAGPF